MTSACTNIARGGDSRTVSTVQESEGDKITKLTGTRAQRRATALVEF